MDDQKLVEFDKYCNLCKHYEKAEEEDPCWDCLRETTNSWSHKPMYFEEKEGSGNDSK